MIFEAFWVFLGWRDGGESTSWSSAWRCSWRCYHFLLGIQVNVRPWTAKVRIQALHDVRSVPCLSYYFLFWYGVWSLYEKEYCIECRFGVVEVPGQSGERPVWGFIELEGELRRGRSLYLVRSGVLGRESGNLVSDIDLMQSTCSFLDVFFAFRSLFCFSKGNRFKHF